MIFKCWKYLFDNFFFVGYKILVKGHTFLKALYILFESIRFMSNMHNSVRYFFVILKVTSLSLILEAFVRITTIDPPTIDSADPLLVKVFALYTNRCDNHLK